MYIINFELLDFFPFEYINIHVYTDKYTYIHNIDNIMRLL